MQGYDSSQIWCSHYHPTKFYVYNDWQWELVRDRKFEWELEEEDILGYVNSERRISQRNIILIQTALINKYGLDVYNENHCYSISWWIYILNNIFIISKSSSFKKRYSYVHCYTNHGILVRIVVPFTLNWMNIWKNVLMYKCSILDQLL